jgi:hypothetical protein
VRFVCCFACVCVHCELVHVMNVMLCFVRDSFAHVIVVVIVNVIVRSRDSDRVRSCACAQDNAAAAPCSGRRVK